jgi:hypothetical protein
MVREASTRRLREFLREAAEALGGRGGAEADQGAGTIGKKKKRRCGSLQQQQRRAFFGTGLGRRQTKERSCAKSWGGKEEEEVSAGASSASASSASASSARAVGVSGVAASNKASYTSVGKVKFVRS